MEMECDYVVKSSVCSINEAAVYTIKSVKEELEDLKLEWFDNFNLRTNHWFQRAVDNYMDEEDFCFFHNINHLKTEKSRGLCKMHLMMISGDPW